MTESNLGLNPQVAQGGPGLLRQVAADRSKQAAGATAPLIFCLSLQSIDMQWTLHGSKFAQTNSGKSASDLYIALMAAWGKGDHPTPGGANGFSGEAKKYTFKCRYLE